jgi:hypothetical protein
MLFFFQNTATENNLMKAFFNENTSLFSTFLCYELSCISCELSSLIFSAINFIMCVHLANIPEANCVIVNMGSVHLQRQIMNT